MRLADTRLLDPRVHTLVLGWGSDPYKVRSFTFCYCREYACTHLAVESLPLWIRDAAALL